MKRKNRESLRFALSEYQHLREHKDRREVRRDADNGQTRRGCCRRRRVIFPSRPVSLAITNPVTLSQIQGGGIS